MIPCGRYGCPWDVEKQFLPICCAPAGGQWSHEPHGALGQGRQILIGKLDLNRMRLEQSSRAAHRSVDMGHTEEPDLAADESLPVRGTHGRGERKCSLSEGLELHHAGQMIQRVVEESGVGRIDLHLPGC